MTHTALTAALSETWNFKLDANGDLELLRGADAVCQNVSNECRCFTDDLYFQAQRGIAWFDDQLGKGIQLAVTASRLRTAAESVPGVESVASVEITADDESRRLAGSINLRLEGGDNGRAEIR